MKKLNLFVLFFLFFSTFNAQELDFPKKKNTYGGLFSLGTRTTLSAFNSDKATSLGYGGNFRIQISERVSTDWFADYLPSVNDFTRREDFHIGWSVVYYLANNNKRFQPYVLAGHCFDYSRFTEKLAISNNRSRWSSAIQGGLGIQLNCTNRLSLNLSTQFMGHLGKEIGEHIDGT